MKCEVEKTSHWQQTSSIVQETSVAQRNMEKYQTGNGLVTIMIRDRAMQQIQYSEQAAPVPAVRQTKAIPDRQSEIPKFMSSDRHNATQSHALAAAAATNTKIRKSLNS